MFYYIEHSVDIDISSMRCTFYIWAAFIVLGGETVLLGDQTAVAVCARASANYVRPRLADGTFAPESFAFGQGGVPGGDVRDSSLDGMNFMDVLKVISEPLADQKYVASHDPRNTRLLIMVYWGATSVGDGPSGSIDYSEEGSEKDGYANLAAGQAIRDLKNLQNARLLGYESWWKSTLSQPGTPLYLERRDMFGELEDTRYFVVLMAYDFQELWRHRRSKLLWETRYSIRERGHDFGRDLAAMTKDAARYFGKDSGGLVHHAIPEARVEVGPVRTLGVRPGN